MVKTYYRRRLRKAHQPTVTEMDRCGDKEAEDKREACLSELRCNGMVRWGVRKRVRYLGRHNESDGNGPNAHKLFSRSVDVDEEAQFELVVSAETESENEVIEDDGGDKIDIFYGDCKEKQEQDEYMAEYDSGDGVHEDDQDEEQKMSEINQYLKRRRYPLRNIGKKNRKREKLKTDTQKFKERIPNQSKKKKSRLRFKETSCVKNPKDRWSSERYKLAEQNLLDVMKAKGATAKKPILRPQLRAEARKRIGDTGLLDHLLKHVAEKLAPGGKERFRRRVNPDGAMEYWLESSDLISIRRDAGVTDPYWVPPPGWRPGDSPTQDPICARELKLLKNEISEIKRNLDLMTTKLQLEEELGKFRSELDERRGESEAIGIAPRPLSICQKLDFLPASGVSSKSDLEKGNYKEQLMAMGGSVKEIEGKIEILTSNLGEGAKLDSASTESPDKEKRQAGNEPKSAQVDAFISAVGERSRIGSPRTAEPGESRELKSAFRICRPEATFLWPNMVKNNSIISMIDPNVNSQKQQPSLDTSTMLWENGGYGPRNMMDFNQRQFNACSFSSAPSLPSNQFAQATHNSASDDPVDT